MMASQQKRAGAQRALDSADHSHNTTLVVVDMQRMHLGRNKRFLAGGYTLCTKLGRTNVARACGSQSGVGCAPDCLQGPASANTTNIEPPCSQRACSDQS